MLRIYYKQTYIILMDSHNFVVDIGWTPFSGVMDNARNFIRVFDHIDYGLEMLMH